MSQKFGRAEILRPHSGVTQTVTGLRLSTAEIISDYFKGSRPMTTPAPNQYDDSDEHAGFTSAYDEHEFLQRKKSEYQAALRSQRETAERQQADKDARFRELEAHFERTKHLSDPPPAQKQ